ACLLLGLACGRLNCITFMYAGSPGHDLIVVGVWLAWLFGLVGLTVWAMLKRRFGMALACIAGIALLFALCRNRVRLPALAPTANSRAASVVRCARMRNHQ